jgi:peptide/nickel transport system substrate-binding protein
MFALAASSAFAATFKFANQGDPLSMDPHAQNESLLISFMGNVYEGLTERGKQLELKPALAESWKQTAPSVWRFNLRKGVKFHDGKPFTADDVIFSLKRCAADGSDMKTYVAEIADIKKIDDHTIDFATREPFPILPDVLAYAYIMNKEWAEKNNAVSPEDVRKGKENYATLHANGTGPFVLKSREPGVKTVLTANPNWWGKVEHNVSEAIFTPVANRATRVAALIAGDIDMMEPVPLQDTARINQNLNLKVLQGPEMRTIFLGMDQARDELLFSNVKGKNPFKDKRVRQAFYQALDIEAIKAKVMRGAATPTGLMVAPSVQGFTQALNQRLPHDPQAAKKLLGEAGYPDGFEVGMNCPNDRYVNDAEICQAVSAMLARIGVKVNLMAEPKATYFPKILSRNTSFYLLGWTPSTGDSHNAIFALLASAKGTSAQGQFNLGSYKNARVDELTKQIASETDLKKRQAMISEVFKIHQDEIGHIPLHQQMLTWGLKKNIELVQRADNFNMLKWVRIK